VTVLHGADRVALTASMRDRDEGYVTELPYTLGYYPELDPRRARKTLASAGVEIAPIRRACELGFGRGLSVAIHAVAGDAEWWGNDLLPQHVEEVETLTRGLTDRLHISAETFAEFCTREDLPEFDFIALHGVWSWISENNRQIIKAFIDRKLATGGVLYLSYNTRKAWESVLPLRKFLVTEAAKPELASRALADRIEAALVAAQQVVARDLLPARDDPAFEKHLRIIRHQAKPYLAHEYFNRDWALFDEANLSATFGPLGLAYVTQANGVTESTGFRRDLWVRGRAPTSSTSLALVPETSVVDPSAVHELNVRLLRRALNEPYLSTLASPVTGGGIELGWRVLLALRACQEGARDASTIASKVSAAMTRLGHPFVHEDVVIKDPAEVASMLRREAESFLATTLKKLDQLGVVSGNGRAERI
jgi:SAM-dependent methyltransferase